jgi:hypothetical protein
MENKITVNIQGGLGNQMFQIATLYAVAHDNNIEYIVQHIKESPSVFKNRPVYWDNIFKKVKTTELLYKFSNILQIREQSSLYNKIVLNNNINNILYLLNGYFQSEKYFSHIRDKILSLFSLNEEQNMIINTIKQTIKSKINNNKECVAVHVRRGDYLKLSHFHVVQTMDYYNNAMLQFENVNFIIFSDDIVWCRENFKNDNNYFYENINNNILPSDVIEMYLMSLFEHNIIANSSFSWWAAWMNKNENKKVIAPSRWLVDNHNNNMMKDIYCDKWVRL